MRHAATFLLTLLAAVGSAFAQAPPERLTLNDAVIKGLEASHRLAESRAREEAARAAQEQRSASALPQVAILAGYMRTNHVQEFSVPSPAGGVRVIYPDVPDNYRSRIDLQWPIYTGGRTAALVGAAGGEVNALSQDRNATAADLKLDITRAYWALLTARASVDVVGQALNRTEAHLRDVRNQLTVGLVPPSDVLSIEAQRARQELLVIEAQNLVTTSEADFRRLAGLSPDAPFELVDPLQRAAAPSRDAIAAVEAARANRAERKSLEIRLDAARLRTSAAAAGRKPSLVAAAGYDMARPNPRIFPRDEAWKPSWDLGISVSWSVFDGGRVRAEVAEADANRRAVEERLKEFDSVIEVEVRQRAADLRSADASIAAAEAGVRAAQEARRVIAERFGEGVATNTDVLNAQVALLQAELDRTRALANTQLAAARFDRALGR